MQERCLNRVLWNDLDVHSGVGKPTKAQAISLSYCRLTLEHPVQPCWLITDSSIRVASSTSAKSGTSPKIIPVIAW